MTRRFDALLGALAIAASLAACGGGSGGSVAPPGGGGPTPTPVPSGAGAESIGIALPSGPIGTVDSAQFGVLGGFTQQTYSQVLAFPPGTTVTLKNLSSTTPHTLNVLGTSAFPAAPSLSTSASGSSTLDANYASGSIAPGGSVTVTLSTPGTYYIGCAYHYMTSPSMRDVLLVSSSATPGPQATPQPSSTGTPSPGGGYGY